MKKSDLLYFTFLISMLIASISTLSYIVWDVVHTTHEVERANELYLKDHYKVLE